MNVPYFFRSGLAVDIVVDLSFIYLNYFPLHIQKAQLGYFYLNFYHSQILKNTTV